LEVLLLILLLVVAVAVFLPDILRERMLESPLDTISDFHRGMRALAWSTHNTDPRTEAGYARNGLYYSTGGHNDPEPYVRRSQYQDRLDEYSDDFIPYPRNRARMEMIARRNRIIAALLVVVLSTGILVLVPKLKWVIPLHVFILVVMSIYIFVVILRPQNGRR
jgi:hypothetical protein